MKHTILSCNEASSPFTEVQELTNLTFSSLKFNKNDLLTISFGYVIYLRQVES